MAMFLFADSVASTHPTESMMVTQNLPPFVYQFYPYTNYPHILGVQVDLFWNGSESELTIVGLWRCAVWWGHDRWNSLEDEVTPAPPLLWTWQVFSKTFLELNPQGHLFRIWQGAVWVSWYSLSIVFTVFISWRSWYMSRVSWLNIALAIQNWNNCNLYFFCAIMH